MRFRTAIGVGLIFSSFAMFASGSYLVHLTTDAKMRADRQLLATEQQCLRLLSTIEGAMVTPVADEITLVISSARDPRKALTDATVATLMCPNKIMVEACLGDECLGAGEGEIGMRLKFKGKS